jgi:predicted P-loop ATPase/GTPase
MDSGATMANFSVMREFISTTGAMQLVVGLPLKYFSGFNVWTATTTQQ